MGRRMSYVIDTLSTNAMLVNHAPKPFDPDDLLKDPMVIWFIR